VNDAVLRDRYDVLVVGAGLGWMTAANLLAKRGLSVLMIEQQGKPGGCAGLPRPSAGLIGGSAGQDGGRA